MLQQISSFSTLFILICAAVHLLLFIVVRSWAFRELSAMASLLDDFTRPLKHRSVLDKYEHLTDQVEAFLADVNEVIENPKREEDRKELSHRMNILDEKRRYISGMGFVTLYNMCRTMIEAYPLAGVMGTILAIGAALQFHAASGATSTVNVIVERFGDAIWSTFSGLVITITLMFLNSLLEPSLDRISELKKQIRDMVAKVKRDLNLESPPEILKQEIQK